MSHTYAILIRLFILVILSLPAANGFTENHLPSEARVKAAYIFNFAKLIDWPESSFEQNESPLYLGVVGEDPVVEALAGIEGKTVRGRPIIITRFKRNDTVSGCHILFIGISEQNQYHQYLSNLQNIACLTVSTIDRFAHTGGMINFIIVNNRIRFEINISATRAARLNISSRLLKVATVVNGKPERSEP